MTRPLSPASGPLPGRDRRAVRHAAPAGRYRIAEERHVAVVGRHDDAGASAVSFRYRDGTQDNGVPADAAIDRIVAAIESREQV